MATTPNHEALAHTGRKKRTRRLISIDMTPMVDLAFLLLTFFMLTTRLSEPTSLEIVYPNEKGNTTVGGQNCSTILIDEPGTTGVYHGMWPGSERLALLQMPGLREELLKMAGRDNNGRIHAAGENKRIVIVKTNERTRFRDVIDVVDELNISGIGRYAIQDMNGEELKAVRQLSKKIN